MPQGVHATTSTTSRKKSANKRTRGATTTASHWTEEQIKALNKRKQPVVTFNRIARKLNGVVGLIDRLKQDPKAYPRTPKHEEGAESRDRGDPLRARHGQLERQVARSGAG